MVTTRSGSSYRDPSLFRTTYGRVRQLEIEVEPEDIEGETLGFDLLPVVPPPMANAADAMMAPRGLPIVMPPDLVPRPMPVHLPKFSGMAYEDPSNHIERYIEALVANVILEETYRLVMFSTTLRGAA
jgi:hypothetical protein